MYRNMGLLILLFSAVKCNAIDDFFIRNPKSAHSKRSSIGIDFGQLRLQGNKDYFNFFPKIYPAVGLYLQYQVLTGLAFEIGYFWSDLREKKFNTKINSNWFNITSNNYDIEHHFKVKIKMAQFSALFIYNDSQSKIIPFLRIGISNSKPKLYYQSTNVNELTNVLQKLKPRSSLIAHVGFGYQANVNHRVSWRAQYILSQMTASRIDENPTGYSAKPWKYAHFFSIGLNLSV